jgi:two-component system OmpR family response regulator
VRILLVDDDETLRRTLGIGLRAAEYDVLIAADGRSALQALREDKPDLVVLDLGLPDLSGVEVLRQLRAWSTVPVVVLSARAESGEMVQALDLGADDYVTKPFSLDEVLARIRAVLKRTRQGTHSSRLRVADLELDEDVREVRRGGTVIALTPTEYRLLRFLMVNAGRVVSKGQILDHVWEYNPAGDGNVVEPCISYLRRKVDHVEPRLIHTIRGFGYVLRIPPP